MWQSCETVAVFCHFDNVELRISSVCKLPEFPTPTEVGYFGYHQFIFPFSKFISFGLLFILLQSSIANYHCVFIFTSFNGKRDHKVSVSRDYQMVGSGDRSPEITSQLSYLNRPPPGAKFPKAKNGQVGEIGWLYETFRIVKGIWYTVTPLPTIW
jgi:hypothetical protein